MKGQPIIVALGLVCAFSLGWAVRGFQSQPPQSDGLARAVINGHTIEYAPGSVVEFETDGDDRHDAGTHTTTRDTTATSGGLTTSSADVAANYQQTAPTDGLGGSGGGIIATVEAVGGKPMNALYVIAALCVVGGAVVTFWLKMPGLGLGLATGGLGVAAIAYFASEQPWVFWLLIPLAGAAGICWLHNNGNLKATNTALRGVVKAVELAPKEAKDAVKANVEKAVGKRAIATVDRVIEKAKAHA